MRDEARLLEILNRTGESLASELDVGTVLQRVTDAATELTGAKFGAFFYTSRTESGKALMLYTLSGAPREAFEGLGHPRPTPIFSPTFKGEQPLRIAKGMLRGCTGDLEPVSNAVKFTPAGGEVNLIVREQGSEMVIAVEDTGAGIRKEVLEHVFERFRQADSSITRKFGGLGLGLSIARHIVSMHAARSPCMVMAKARAPALKFCCP